MLLGGALLYHALNGIRILLMDFWPRLTVYHKQIWYANWVIFVVAGVPGGVHHPQAHLRRCRGRREMALYSRSGRPRPQSGGFELAAWYYMRLSGVALFVLALTHFSVMHFLFDPAQEKSGFISAALERHRWSAASTGCS